jgi:putative membrane protein
MKKLPIFCALALLGACANPTNSNDDTDKGKGTQQDMAGAATGAPDSTDATVVGGTVGTRGTDGIDATDQRPAEDPKAPGAAVTPDANFANTALADGTFEVQMAQRILKDSKDANVRQFAEKMIADHTKVGDELRQLAKAQGMNVTDRLTNEQTGVLGEMEKMTGKSLQTMYIKQAVDGHEAAVSTFNTTAQSSGRPELKAFAAKHLPALKMHLQMAKDLQAGKPMMKM